MGGMFGEMKFEKKASFYRGLDRVEEFRAFTESRYIYEYSISYDRDGNLFCIDFYEYENAEDGERETCSGTLLNGACIELVETILATLYNFRKIWA